MAMTTTAPRSAIAAADPVRKNRLLLRQLTTCGGAWTDGNRIYEGADLAKKRRDTLHALHHNKVSKEDRPLGGAAPPTGTTWESSTA